MKAILGPLLRGRYQVSFPDKEIVQVMNLVSKSTYQAIMALKDGRTKQQLLAKLGNFFTNNSPVAEAIKTGTFVSNYNIMRCIVTPIDQFDQGQVE
jgi:hypothetical protein